MAVVVWPVWDRDRRRRDRPETRVEGVDAAHHLLTRPSQLVRGTTRVVARTDGRAGGRLGAAERVWVLYVEG